MKNNAVGVVETKTRMPWIAAVRYLEMSVTATGWRKAKLRIQLGEENWNEIERKLERDQL